MPLRKYRFPLRKPGFLSCNTKLCLWRADGDIRQAERSPNIPPDNDPCPTKIAHQPEKEREGGWAQAIFVAWRVAGSTCPKLTPVNSSHPLILPFLRGNLTISFIVWFNIWPDQAKAPFPIQSPSQGPRFKFTQILRSAFHLLDTLQEEGCLGLHASIVHTAWQKCWLLPLLRICHISTNLQIYDLHSQINHQITFDPSLELKCKGDL